MKMKLTSSNSSWRGTQVSSSQQEDIQHWSHLEQRVGTILLADPTVRDLYSQEPTVVVFTGEDGVEHIHRFDYFAFLHDGSAVAYNVKLVKDLPSVEVLFRRLGALGLGYKVVVVTEEEATPGRTANARCILKARKNFNEKDYIEALKSIGALRGRVLFHHLLNGARNIADRREALWALIDAGVLVIDKELERLADYSYVVIDRDALAQELKNHDRAAA